MRSQKGGQAGIDLFTYEGRRMSFRSCAWLVIVRLRDYTDNRVHSTRLTGNSPRAPGRCRAGRCRFRRAHENRRGTPNNTHRASGEMARPPQMHFSIVDVDMVYGHLVPGANRLPCAASAFVEEGRVQTEQKILLQIRTPGAPTADSLESETTTRRQISTRFSLFHRSSLGGSLGSTRIIFAAQTP